VKILVATPTGRDPAPRSHSALVNSCAVLAAKGSISSTPVTLRAVQARVWTTEVVAIPCPEAPLLTVTGFLIDTSDLICTRIASSAATA